VGFYAGLACLSTKHFSDVVKQETGHTAAYWIHRQVVVEAKMLLHMRRDLTVQAISYMLGFDEQATFSRYFRRETGLSPSEFRSTDNSGGDEKRRECFAKNEK
jgi:AraC-like DNA-binding protein